MSDKATEVVRLINRTGDVIAKAKIPLVRPAYDLITWDGRFYKRILGDKHLESTVLAIMPEQVIQ